MTIILRQMIICLTLLTISCAHIGQTADVATTSIGIAQGASELNPAMAHLVGSPVGLVALLGIKLGAVHYANQQAPQECIALTQGLSDVGWAAAISNGVVLMFATPLAFPIGIIGGIASHYLAGNSIRSKCRQWCQQPPSSIGFYEYQRRCPTGWSVDW